MSVPVCREGSEHGLGNGIRNGQKPLPEVPPEHEEEFLPCAVTEPWGRLPGQGVGSPSLEVPQNHPDTILCHVLRGDPAWAGRLEQ